MGYWIEIHCDFHFESPSDYFNKNLKNYCYSKNNESVGHMSRSTQNSLLKTLKNAQKEAIEQGWKYKNRKWVCPNCKTLRSEIDGK